jgi:8-amino-7-oxononanoate synthase
MAPEDAAGFDLGGRLQTREEAGLRRDIEPVEDVRARSKIAPDPRGDPPEFEETSLIFAANNYLGLAGDERVAEQAAQTASNIGTGAGASRLVVGDTPAHRSLERSLAEKKGAERALVFSSGYATNVGTLSALDPDVIFSDELNHASIIDGARLSKAEVEIYDHCDPDSLASAMADRAPVDGDESWLVVTDSIFSMDGDIAPLEALCAVTDEYGAWMMVDEAHATGVYEGGIVGKRGLSDRIEVQLGTLSKALGAQGGFIAGDEELIEYLLNAARSFIFSTGLAPPAATAAQRALELAPTRRDDLWENVDHLRTELAAMGYDIWGESHILPVVVGDRDDAVALDGRLRESGIVVPAIRPPSVPEGTSRLRLTPQATHTAEEIEMCLSAFEHAGEEVGVI